jgi:PAS domain S-box-containing protein
MLPVSELHSDGRLFRLNRATSRILGWPADELLSKSPQEITHPDDLAADLVYLKELSEGKIDNYSLDMRDRRKDGTFVWVRRTTSCVRETDGSTTWWLL